MFKRYLDTPAPALTVDRATLPAERQDSKRCPGRKGQDGVRQRIIGQMRPHSVYVEGYLGDGVVFWEKRRAPSSILIDVNPQRIAAANAALSDAPGVRTIVGNAIKLLPDLLAWLPADAVIYLDPPYMLGKRTKQLLYRFGGQSDEMTDDDHATLLKVILQAKCDVLISGYPSELYSSQLKAWRCLSYQTRTRGATVTECLWCNFEEPEELHDWRFAGFNYRERFGLKRFVQGWLARLDKMPARRRGYIQNELRTALEQRTGQSVRPVDPATQPLAMVHGK